MRDRPVLRYGFNITTILGEYLINKARLPCFNRTVNERNKYLSVSIIHLFISENAVIALPIIYVVVGAIGLLIKPRLNFGKDIKQRFLDIRIVHKLIGTIELLLSLARFADIAGIGTDFLGGFAHYVTCTPPSGNPLLKCVGAATTFLSPLKKIPSKVRGYQKSHGACAHARSCGTDMNCADAITAAICPTQYRAPLLS